MEDNSRREENNEVTEDMRDDRTARVQERISDYQYQLIPRSPSNRNSKRPEQYDKKLSRSRSRSRSKPLRRKQRTSANAFFNFMEDFKQHHGRTKSKDLLRLGGQKWRRMSSAEKMPYIMAANLVKQQTQQNGKSGEQNKPNNSDSLKKPENQKDQKKKQERKKRSKSRTYDSDMDSDSATSRTGATTTSEDVSDLSS